MNYWLPPSTPSNVEGEAAGGTSFRMCIETFVDIIRRPLWR